MRSFPNTRASVRWPAEGTLPPESPRPLRRGCNSQASHCDTAARSSGAGCIPSDGWPEYLEFRRRSRPIKIQSEELPSWPTQFFSCRAPTRSIATLKTAAPPRHCSRRSTSLACRHFRRRSAETFWPEAERTSQDTPLAPQTILRTFGFAFFASHAKGESVLATILSFTLPIVCGKSSSRNGSLAGREGGSQRNRVGLDHQQPTAEVSFRWLGRFQSDLEAFECVAEDCCSVRRK